MRDRDANGREGWQKQRRGESQLAKLGHHSSPLIRFSSVADLPPPPQ
jgi:hypothetical protein